MIFILVYIHGYLAMTTQQNILEITEDYILLLMLVEPENILSGQIDSNWSISQWYQRDL